MPEFTKDFAYPDLSRSHSTTYSAVNDMSSSPLHDPRDNIGGVTDTENSDPESRAPRPASEDPEARVAPEQPEG